jgi:hypothetical protein
MLKSRFIVMTNEKDKTGQMEMIFLFDQVIDAAGGIKIT